MSVPVIRRRMDTWVFSSVLSVSMICEKGSSALAEASCPPMVRYSTETKKTPLKISLLPMALVSVTMPLARQWSSSAAPSRPSDRDMVSEKVRSFSATCRSKDTVCPQHRFSTSSVGSVSASEEMVRHTFRQPARWVTSLQRVKIFRGFSIRLSSNSISVSTTTWAHPANPSPCAEKGMANSSARTPDSFSGV